MDLVLVLALAMALAFAFTNGFNDAANAIASLVATRAARPLPAVLMAAFFNLVGPLFFGAAVADTIAGIVVVAPREIAAVTGAGLTGAVIWSTWARQRGLPSSSSHALVGGLVGASLLAAGSGAIRWGGLNGIHPSGVFGILIAMAAVVVISALVGFVIERLALAGAAHLSRRAARPVRALQWGHQLVAGFFSWLQRRHEDGGDHDCAASDR